MNEFMKILLSLSVSGTLLLLLIRGMKRLYKNKFSRRWQYYIWIIVVLRFLLPFTPDTTFVHELIHYKQKDMFYKWLIQIAVCIHWFNPFIYSLEKEANKSCELSCDEKVISILDEKARHEYGDTLISFLRSNNLYQSSLASVTLTEGAEELKERLGAIMIRICYWGICSPTGTSGKQN